MADSEITQVIRSALDRERHEHALPNDNELARHLGISPKTLSFWRNGRLGRSSVVIVKLLSHPSEPKTTELPVA
jgi:transposase-like protein